MSTKFFDNFYQVSNRLASCKQINKAHLLIISDTYQFTVRGRINFKSQTRIANECGVSRRTVNRAIKDLKGWGLLKCEEARFKETLKMAIHPARLMHFIEENENKEISDPAYQTKDDIEFLKDIDFCDETESHNRCANLSQPLCQNDSLKDHLPEQEQEQLLITKSEINLRRDDLSDSKFINELGRDSFSYSHEAMIALSYAKDKGFNVYDGRLTIEEWKACERVLQEADYPPTDIIYGLMNHGVTDNCDKPKSLPYLLMTGVDELEFNTYFGRIMCD